MYVHVKAEHQTTAVQSLEQINIAEVRASGGYPDLVACILYSTYVAMNLY